MRDLRTRLRILPLVALVAFLPGCGDDDDPAAVVAQILGTWEATSFQALGQDFIAQGMTFTATFSASPQTLPITNGSYTFVVTNDAPGLCDDVPLADCTLEGVFSATASEVEIDPDDIEVDALFDYDVDGDMMTWDGSIDDIAITVTMER